MIILTMRDFIYKVDQYLGDVNRFLTIYKLKVPLIVSLMVSCI